MKCKFYQTGSRIYDFLQLPRLLYSNEVFQENNDYQDYKELVEDDYVNFINKALSKLSPFTKDIEVFYMKHRENKYDFIELIMDSSTILSYDSEQDCLNGLLTLDDMDIKRKIIQSILLIDEESGKKSNEIKQIAERICSNNNEMVSFLKNLSIDAGFKWNLFLIAEEPRKYLEMYVHLMTQLLPIFEELYNPFKEDVKKYGTYLSDFLNLNGSKGLEEITFSTLNESILDDVENNIFISVLFPYAITITSVFDNKKIVWGIRMEEAFKKINDLNENKTQKRVLIFKNLGDKTRYEVLKMIASGTTSTKDIAQALGVSSATISYHLSSFITSKIIIMDNTSKKFGYVVDYQLLEETFNDLKEDLNFPK